MNKTLADVIKLMRNPQHAEKIIIIKKQTPALLKGVKNDNNRKYQVQHS